MSNSEFRWNKRRKHYAYIHKSVGTKRINILISSKPEMIEKQNKKKQRITNNVPLYHHPNPTKQGQFYLIPHNYVDDVSSFDEETYDNWLFDRNDKRKVKRIKKRRKKKSRLRHQLR